MITDIVTALVISEVLTATIIVAIVAVAAACVWFVRKVL